MHESSVKSERGTTYYWIWRNDNKKAKCIVFTHGLCANRTMFDKQTEYFLNDYTVITWDVPMHGKSRPYRDFSYSNAAKELNTILEAENIYEVVLVGMSMGGFPCQEFVLNYPNKVIAFVGIGTTPFGECYYSKFDKWCAENVYKLISLYPTATLYKSIAKLHSKTEYSFNIAIEMFSSSSKEEICEQVKIGYGGFFVHKKSVRFSCPVLILVGEYDRTGKVMQYCKAWAKREGYPIKVIKNAAHMANTDNYIELNQAMDEFFKENGI